MRLLGVALAVALFSAPVWGQELIFSEDFESGDTSGWWAPARVRETGQVTCYDVAGGVVPCDSTGQDGDIRPGVAWPSPRFVDNGDGTVTDTLTGLLWLKNANCLGLRTWTQALTDANGLATGSCGLSDGSAPRDWRLPSFDELRSLLDYEYSGPAVSNAAGTGQWTEGDPFTGVLSGSYWSSSSLAIPGERYRAFSVSFLSGYVDSPNKASAIHLWPVRNGWWAPARVGATGQVTCYDGAGLVVSCAGTGQDGDLRPGVAWPNPRFVVNGDGTVTDMLTGLVWLRNANCFWYRTWTQALADANSLASGACGLSDGSVAGEWRLPSVNELASLAYLEHSSPALSNAAGTGQWTEGDAFTSVRTDFQYWSSSSHAYDPSSAWSVYFYAGNPDALIKAGGLYVWPVRGGR
jgi:hypothetical protein